ncbi:Six-hairpin glycosidase-like protein [Thamnidium elegans]|nr:Six-hairpin glycosidase-like protein [Thamnidium elegans]
MIAYTDLTLNSKIGYRLVNKSSSASIDIVCPGPDSNIPIPRPCFQINETNFGTDAASMAATAFASASHFFNQLAQSKAGNQEDSKYAETLLMHATQLYNSSHNIFPYSRYQTSVHAVEDAYASTDYMDDLILSGVAMYRATRNITYLDQSLELYKATAGISSHSEPLGWDNKWGALYVLFAELMLDSPDHSEALERRIDAENYLDNIVSGITVNKTNGGLLFWDFFSNSNSNQNAMSASHLLLSYSAKVLRPLSEKSSDKDTMLTKIKRYEDLANSQLDYIFGKNPINQNYVVGELPNSPKYPHSASASGFKTLNEAIKNPSDLSQAHIIYGAMVGGPSKNDSFSDILLDWTQAEVALDYNAPYQNVLAYQVMFNPKSPFYVSDIVDSNNQDEKPKTVSSPVPLWGIVLAVVLPVLIFISLFTFLLIRRRNQKDTEKEQSSSRNNIDQEERTIRQLGVDEFRSSGSTLVVI